MAYQPLSAYHCGSWKADVALTGRCVHWPHAVVIPGIHITHLAYTNYTGTHHT